MHEIKNPYKGKDYHLMIKGPGKQYWHVKYSSQNEETTRLLLNTKLKLRKRIRKKIQGHHSSAADNQNFQLHLCVKVVTCDLVILLAFVCMLILPVSTVNY